MESGLPATPIVILDGDDVIIFDSLEDAQYGLESPDVSEGIYTGFDAGGRLLTIATDGRDTFITLTQPEVMQRDVLESRLRGYLQHVGESRWNEECDLRRLVEIAKEHVNRPNWVRRLIRRAD